MHPGRGPCAPREVIPWAGPGRPGTTARIAVLLGAAAALMVAHSALHALPRWEFGASLGGAWNIPLPVRLRQDGYEDLEQTAHWSTRGLKPPLYYALRIARWQGEHGWALDLTHHKLHLENPPREVGSFAISHGYNLLTVQRLVERAGWRYGVALGVVVAHPESEVRGQRFDERHGLFKRGYYLSGPSAGLLAGRSHRLTGPLHATAETKLTFSFANVPIAGGSARVPNLALHASAGLGWRPGR